MQVHLSIQTAAFQAQAIFPGSVHDFTARTPHLCCQQIQGLLLRGSPQHGCLQRWHLCPTYAVDLLIQHQQPAGKRIQAGLQLRKCHLEVHGMREPITDKLFCW